MPRSACDLLRAARADFLPRAVRNSNSTETPALKRSVDRRLVWLLGILFLTVGCEKPDAAHHFATLLDTPTRLGPEWVELSPVDSLRADRDNNCLLITLGAGYQWTDRRTEFVDLASGDTVQFQADLVLADGRRYHLERQGVRLEYDREPRVTVCGGDPRSGQPRWFRNAFIRAARPVAIRRIEWESYDASL